MLNKTGMDYSCKGPSDSSLYQLL